MVVMLQGLICHFRSGRRPRDGMTLPRGSIPPVAGRLLLWQASRLGENAMRRLNLLFVSVVIAASGPALAVPQGEAEQAYAQRDYATAFKIWLPLAEQGSARAARNIAGMYERGEWVAQDSAMAGEWYRKAAEFNANDVAMASPGQSPSAYNPAQAVQASAPPPVTLTQPVAARPVVYAPVYYPP